VGLFSRHLAAAPQTEQRTNVQLPGWLFAGQPSYAEVDTSRADSSLQAVAVRSTADLIASMVSELPVYVYSGKGVERVQRPTPGYLLDPAGDGHGLADWAYQGLMSWLLRGNLYGDVLDRRGAMMTQVVLHHPDDVSGYLDDDGRVQWLVNGQPVRDPTTFVHRRVNPMPGRVQGLSPVAFHAETIGLSITTTKFGRQWFTDGAHPGGILTNDLAEMNDPDMVRTVKDRFLAALRGTREPAVLGKGWKYQSIQVNPEESQFLQTQGFTAAECCRIFGPGFAEILGYESGGSMTYANVESRVNALLVFALDKWFTRMERLLTEMLPRPQYACIDRDALLQSTTLERFQSYQLALQNRWKTVNEIRAAENLPPVSWGDEPNQLGPPAMNPIPGDYQGGQQ
jgi:HK97 family phage portal protein